jgi:hypothetical protein
MFKNLCFLCCVAWCTQSQADSLDDFIQYLTPTNDPTPVALKPIAKLQEAAMAAIKFCG